MYNMIKTEMSLVYKREHHKKLCCIWGRLNSHTIWRFNWASRLAARINVVVHAGDLMICYTQVISAPNRRFNWASRLTTSIKLSLKTVGRSYFFPLFYLTEIDSPAHIIHKLYLFNILDISINIYFVFFTGFLLYVRLSLIISVWYGIIYTAHIIQNYHIINCIQIVNSRGARFLYALPA